VLYQSMMTNALIVVGELSDHDLLERVRDAAGRERAATARLVALLVELDARRLYLGEGYSSLFTYCTQALHYSEHAAYNRIETARAARRFPTILGLIESGDVTLTAVRMLAPHLTDVNHRDVLEQARHKSKREIELLLATLNPRPDAPSIVRKQPTPAATTLPPSPPPAQATPDISTSVAAVAPARPTLRPTEIKPLAPERYKIQFTVNRETYEQLRRVQDLLRHTVPNGDPAIIFERGLRLLIADLERARMAKVEHPRDARAAKKASRHIPAAVKRAVWQRDNGRCAFKGPHGRCAETGFLEYHHVVPFADGGETSPSNLELRCRAHNQYEADLWFGGPQAPLARETHAPFGA
jgi:hypothetical protein